MQEDIPKWKVAATVGGSALTLNAVWLNAAHVASAEGWSSPLVSAGIVVTLCAAVAPPFAERAMKSGQPLKAALLWIFFALAVGFSQSASIARSSSYATSKVANAEHGNERARLARDSYDDAKKTQEAECGKRGPRCRAAEDAVTAARSALATASPVVATDPGAERLAAVLGVQESAVQLYAPLLLPLGLEIGGFIFLAAGMAPRRREKEVAPADPLQQPESVAAATPAVAKRGTRDYWLQRLQRDHHAIAKRVQSGKISVYAGCIEAGLRKPAVKKWTQVADYLPETIEAS